MTPFQILGVALFSVGALLSSVSFIRSRGARRSSVVFFLVCLAGATAFARPNATSEVARFVGIQRGADLVLYLTTLSFIIGSFLGHLRARKQREDITILTRELALLRASLSDSEKLHTKALSKTETEQSHGIR